MRAGKKAAFAIVLTVLAAGPAAPGEAVPAAAPKGACGCTGAIRAQQVEWNRIARLAADPAAAQRQGLVVTK